jgi:hypothetical protein
MASFNRFNREYKFTSDSTVNLGKNHPQPRKIWPAFAAAAIARQAGRSMSSAWWLNEQ